ncbi:MAG TPA: hypothetical protein VMF68_09915, partial [Spirochaetia bacterium]|nr:hypothetical protein [Spirochaetia bacterium]
MKRKGWILVVTVVVGMALGGGLLAAASKSAKEITAFTVAGVDGVIDDKTITVELPGLFTRVDGLVATFTTTGKSLKVGPKVQVSGKTPNDFTKPVTYTVAAADGTTDSYTVRVLTPRPVLISAYDDTLVVGSDGSLWGTGRNGDGQLGLGNTNSVSSPKRIMESGVAAVAAGYYHTLILKTDGSLWATGYAKLGQLGNGNPASLSAPVQVTTGVASVSAGVNFTLVVKTDGSLWVSGYNSSGQLGNGTADNLLTLT